MSKKRKKPEDAFAFLLLQVSHTVTLSTMGESGYRFAATYVGSKQTGPTEVSFLTVVNCEKPILHLSV